MYNHLRGALVEIRPGHVVLETGGVGWLLIAPLSTTSKLGQPGAEVRVLTHLHVREDALVLYGFATEEERALFRTLLGVSGVGAATAVQILSGASPGDFALAIEKQDTKFLTKLKGIGPKTAKRIILELKGAKTVLPTEESVSAPALAGHGSDAVAALEAMGLARPEALARVEKCLATDAEASLEDLIKMALRG